MTKIRLIRIGKKNDPHFRIVVQDSKRAPKGSYIELLGNIAPTIHRIQINEERVKYWLEKGAQPTDSVYNLLVKKSIIIGKKRSSHSKSKKQETDKVKVETVTVENNSNKNKEQKVEKENQVLAEDNQSVEKNEKHENN